MKKKIAKRPTTTYRPVTSECPMTVELFAGRGIDGLGKLGKRERREVLADVIRAQAGAPENSYAWRLLSRIASKLAHPRDIRPWTPDYL